MSRLLLMEVAAKRELTELYNIYFGGNVLLHYEEDISFLVVGTTERMSNDAAVELLNNCKQFKEYHKHLFGLEVKSFVIDERKFKKVKNWSVYFHPNGKYQ